jgi:hypothetical protein
VTVRTFYTLATAVSLGLAGFAHAQTAITPTVTMSNQQLADEVKARIEKSGAAAGANISVTTLHGVVELSGTVVSAKQGELLVKETTDVSGALKVNCLLKVVDVQQTGAADAPISVLPPSAASFDPNAPLAPPAQQQVGGPVNAMPQEPLPLGAPSQPGYDMTGPRLPPYAWPTYAPYPNMSRVAYPQAYPYNAFPFIGPFYPFPKVPLGWRSVKLEWDDGHWYIGRLSTPHDYWRVRFW